MSTISRQLYLFDCDGGRSNLFSELHKQKIPNNYELYLFWNNNDEIITKKLQQLSIHSNVHLAPSHLKNVKNSADGKLIYFLGKLANEFSTITIVGGGDCVYEEVIEAVKYDYPQKKVTLRKIEHPNSSELEMLLGLPSSNGPKNSNENCSQSVDATLQINARIITRSISVVSNQKIRCPECPNRTRLFDPDGLRQHLLSPRKHSNKIIEVSKCPLKVKESKMFCPKGKVKLIHASIEEVFETAKKGKKCPLCPSNKQKYKLPSLYNHLKQNHPACNDVQIQCCDENVTYKDVNEFRQHVLNEPFEMIYKLHA